MKQKRAQHLFLRKQWYKVVESVFIKDNNSRENTVHSSWPTSRTTFIKKRSKESVKFSFSKKTIKFETIFHLFLTLLCSVKTDCGFFQVFVAFSEYMNFTNKHELILIWQFDAIYKSSQHKGWFFSLQFYRVFSLNKLK